jgi:hypothetical protein
VADRPLAPVIDLARARLLRQCDEALNLTRQPLDISPVEIYDAGLAGPNGLPASPRFGSAYVFRGRVVVHCVADMTPDAAERLAHELYRLAGLAREEAERG